MATKVDQTTSLSVSVATRRMLHGTQFKRICKAVEHLYYVILFSSVPTYRGRPGVWESWLSVGTDLAVRIPPSGVAREDQYLDSVHSQPREVSIVVHGNRDAIGELCRALQAIDSARASIAASGEELLAATALGDTAVHDSLVGPLESALETAKLGESQSARFIALLAQSVASLIVEDVTGLSAVVAETDTP